MEKRHKFTVLAPEIVEQIAGMKAGAPELYLSSHALFPSGYMEYLMEVLSINRHLCVYSGETVKPDEPVEEADVWELLFFKRLLLLVEIVRDQEKCGRTPCQRVAVQ